MIERYANSEITQIWSKGNKVELWQKTELAVIKAMADLGDIPEKEFITIRQILKANPIDIAWWLKEEARIKHDLNAFVGERRRFLPLNLQKYFHKFVTSYDIEEPAFALMLKESIKVVRNYSLDISKTLIGMAQKYRYVIMNGRTHGQEAKLQSFGKRILTWFQDLSIDFDLLEEAEKRLQYSKLSGAVGNYGSINPKLEEKALKLLGFKPYFGATQIMPREIYTPTANALCQLILTLNKIALAIRLGARSGRPIFQEPFSKEQTGSSTMPNKKNTNLNEQIEGMARMAMEFCNMIRANIPTWEERTIEQSCVERIAWPNLFHIVIHSLKTMTKILDGLVVYPDNMLREIIESRGTYASDEAKEFLKEYGQPHNLTPDECYRIIQLAAFNAFEPNKKIEKLRSDLPQSLKKTDEILAKFSQIPLPKPISIRDTIARGKLRISCQLSATEKDIQKWNRILEQIFQETTALTAWHQIFEPSYLLRNETVLYEQILGLVVKPT